MAKAKNIAKRPKRYVPWRPIPSVVKRTRLLALQRRHAYVAPASTAPKVAR